MKHKFSTFQIAVSLLLIQIASFWGVLSWYAGRLRSSDGEIWSLLALTAAIAVSVSRARTQSFAFDRFSIVPPTIFVIFYAAAFPFVPPLVRAVLAVTAVALTLSRAYFNQILHFGIYVLLILSLPLAASLNFFAGFPLRVVAGEATAFLLRLNGLSVWREGVCLHFGEQLISIDAPCAGVKMLWFGLFLAAVLISIFNLNFWRSVLALTAAFAVILFGNVARASALFYTETGIVEMPAWAHEAVGVFAFAVVAIGIVAIVQFLRRDFKWSDLQFS